MNPHQGLRSLLSIWSRIPKRTGHNYCFFETRLIGLLFRRATHQRYRVYQFEIRGICSN
jgi:hypothetical protein